MAFTKEQLQNIENGLLMIRAEIELEIKKTEENLDFGDDVEGKMFDEEADEAEELANALPIEKSLNNRLQAIDAALERIKHGTYGVCVNCGTEISQEVLSALPESSLCKDCKRSL